VESKFGNVVRDLHERQLIAVAVRLSSSSVTPPVFVRLDAVASLGPV
jgi:hypothetical protein